MKYAQIKYLGYIKDTYDKVPVSTILENIKSIKIDIPKITKNKSSKIEIKSFNILVKKNTILDILKNIFYLNENIQKLSLCGLMDKEKKIGMLIKIIDYQDQWYDFLILPLFEKKYYNGYSLLAINEKIKKKNIEKKREINIKRNDMFMHQFFCPDVIEIEEKIILPKKLKLTEDKYNKVISLIVDKRCAFNKNYNREVFELPYFERNNVITVQDVRLKRKNEEKPILPMKKTTPPLLIIPKLNQIPKEKKITVIESFEDLKKLNPSTEEKIKKTVSFSSNISDNFYYYQDHLTQVPQVPFKIFINKEKSITEKILNNIKLEDFYIVGLEFDEIYMDGMDMILTWQTGVKLCDGNILLSDQNTLEFLSSLQEQIKKFDLVLLIFIKDSSELPGIGVLENYMSFLDKYNIKFRYLISQDINVICEMITKYLANYVGYISNKEKWRFIQEKICDTIPIRKYRCLNSYCSSIFEYIQEYPIDAFIEACNFLGTSKSRFEVLHGLINKK